MKVIYTLINKKIILNMQERIANYEQEAKQKVVQQSFKKDYLYKLCYTKGFPQIKLNKLKINHGGYFSNPISSEMARGLGLKM